MSREIKFRAWAVKSKRMFVPYYFEEYHYSDEKRVNKVCYHAYADWHELEDGRYVEAEIMQFTGLRDSKGIEIYEGDIVEVTERKTGTLRNGERGLVEWRGCEFVCRSLPPDDWDPMAPCFNPMLAPLLVIGNVHEHPHLLGNESKQPIEQ